MRNKFTIVLFATLILFSATWFPYTPMINANAQPALPIMKRGIDNLDIDYGNNTHVWIGGLEPWMETSNGMYVPYQVSQNSTHYIVDNLEAPLAINKNNCVVTMYDNSVNIANSPSVLIPREWWDVAYHASTSSIWIQQDLSNTACTLSVTTNSSGIFIDTEKPFAVGQLEVIYEKKPEQKWETITNPTNTISGSSYVIKPIQRDPVINADSITQNKNVISSSVKIDSSKLTPSSSTILIKKGDKQFAIDYGNSINNVENINIAKTDNSFSIDADFGKNIPYLLTDQKFSIDPTFGYTQSTNQYEVMSQSYSGCAGTYTNGTLSTGNAVVFDYGNGGVSNYCQRTVVRWNLSSIPTTAVIQSATIKYDVTLSRFDALGCDIFSIEKPTSTDLSTMWTDAQNGTEFVTADSSCHTVSNNHSNTLVNAPSNIQSSLGTNNGWWGIGISGDGDVAYATSHSGGDIESDWANLTLQIVYDIPPNAPTLNNADTLSSSSQQLHWTTSSGATWYKIDRESPTGHGFSTILANTTNATTQWTFANLTAGTQYNYKIYAGNSTGASSASNTEANYTTNIAPTSLSFSNVVTTGFRISWTNPTGNFSGFKIEKESPVGGGWNTVVSNTNNSTNHYDFTGLTPGAQYNVRISTNYATGSSQAGISSPSTSASTFLPTGPVSSTAGADGYFKSSRWYSSNTYSAVAPTTQEASANVLRAFPFIIGKNFTADKIQFEVTSALSSANCNVGIYGGNSTSLYPTKLIVDGGQQSVATVGLKATTINKTLSANNLYWLAYDCDDTPTLSAIPASGIPDILGYSGDSGLGTQGTGWTVHSTYNSTLPSNYPVNGTILSNANGILIQVRAK